METRGRKSYRNKRSPSTTTHLQPADILVDGCATLLRSCQRLLLRLLARRAEHRILVIRVAHDVGAPGETRKWVVGELRIRPHPVGQSRAVLAGRRRERFPHPVGRARATRTVFFWGRGEDAALMRTNVRSSSNDCISSYDGRTSGRAHRRASPSGRRKWAAPWAPSARALPRQRSRTRGRTCCRADPPIHGTSLSASSSSTRQTQTRRACSSGHRPRPRAV
jgi:hypothetical protein